MRENNINNQYIIYMMQSVEAVYMQTEPKEPKEPKEPVAGWNPSFTDRDKAEYADLYIYIKQFHTDIIADIMTQMIIYKRKYHLKY